MASKQFKKRWKKFWQTVLLSFGVQWIVAVLLAIYIWIVFFTSRRKYINYEYFKQCQNKSVIYTFWHGRMMMLSPVMFLAGRRGCVVASQHNGGRTIAKLQRLFGLGAIYGSTTKGALNVLRAGVRVLQHGNYSLCISPDGPGGPSMRMQDGALYFAKMTGAPIVPVSFSASNVRFLKRWDKFMVALPFSKITYVFGAPVFIDRNTPVEEFEKVRANLEHVMLEHIRSCDAKYNLPIVEQDLKAGEYKKFLREQRAAKRKNKGNNK